MCIHIFDIHCRYVAYRSARNYIMPHVMRTWKAQQLFCQPRSQLERNSVCRGDGQSDSPGHSAKYVTYTFIEALEQSYSFRSCTGKAVFIYSNGYLKLRLCKKVSLRSKFKFAIEKNIYSQCVAQTSYHITVKYLWTKCLNFFTASKCLRPDDMPKEALRRLHIYFWLVYFLK